MSRCSLAAPQMASPEVAPSAADAAPTEPVPVAVGLGNRPPRSLADLHWHDDDQARVEAALTQAQGMLVVLGPRGAGLSTTLAVLHAAHPQLPLLLDPLDDSGTALAAMARVAEGRQVLAGMHQQRAAHAFHALRALGVDLPTLSTGLLLTLAQRLVPTLCPACRVPDESVQTRATLARALNSWLGQTSSRPCMAEPAGCARCAGSGHVGVLRLYELIEVDSGVRALVESGAGPLALELGLLSEGQSLWDRGLRALAQGQISLAALRAQVREPC